MTAENQETADTRIPELLAMPVAVRFISYEPTLGPLRMKEDWLPHVCTGYYLPAMRGVRLSGLDWVICGGESGSEARPMQPDWARSLRDQCAVAGVPFFFKQWGEWVALSNSDDGFWPVDSRTCFRLEVDGTKGEHGWPMQRVGKSRASRLLDGKEHNAFPEDHP